jgi:biopolymer transport protein ExbB
MSESSSLRDRTWRFGPILALLWGLTGVGPDLCHAQDGANPPAAAEASPAAAGSNAAVGERTAWDTIKAGGFIGLIIILLSVVSLSAIVYHAITIRKERIMPEAVANRLEVMIKEKEIDEAIEFCRESKPGNLLTDVVMAGLLRYKNSEFGFAEYRAAVEEEGEEQTARLYRQTEVLSVIGAIAPMLGLLGTVQGMIEAFNTIAATGGMAKPSDLADAISKALVTTLEGLMVAIPTLVALSIFRTRIDNLVAEAGKRIEQIMLPLGRHK